jgi:cell division protein FtsW
MNRLLEFFSEKRAHQPDYLITVLFSCLVIFGLVILASASSHLGATQFDDSNYFLKHQLLYGVSIGLIGFFVASKVYYGAYNNKMFGITFLLFSLLLVLAVFTPLGFTAKGATRWLDLGPLSFQPAEFLKLSLVLYLASWLAFKDHRQKSLVTGLLPFAVVLSIVSGILIMQHSTSPVVMLIAVSLVMYFMSGAKIRYLFGIVAAGALLLTLVVAVTPYRAQRVLTFLNPEADVTGSGYQSMQAKTAIGAGGLTGVGYGQSIVKSRLPEPIGDSIFAIAGEEFGFLGSSFLALLFLAVVIRMYVLAARMSDPFGRLVLIGFASFIGVQAFINMGAMTGFLPLTGTPLPFISYGGTNLAVFMTMMGISVNISKHTSE